MEKLCQFRIAELVLCVICMFEPELEMLAVPAATLPPVGNVFAVTSARAGVRKLHGNRALPTANARARG
jgi:hypothetical protein